MFYTLNLLGECHLLIISVGNVAAQRRRQQAVTLRKERREALVRTKRLCRVGVNVDDADVHVDGEMMIDEEQSILEAQTLKAVEELKLAVAYQYAMFYYYLIYFTVC